MEHNVFIYDLLMHGACPEEGHLKESQYIGTGCLYNYKRFGVYFIEETNEPGAVVVGDIYNVDDETYNSISQYYRIFGYHTTIEPVVILKDMESNRDVDCIVFVKGDDDLINKNELELLGSSEPFKWLSECFEILDDEFKDLWKGIGKSNMIHFRTNNIDDFKKEIEQYAKENPDSKIYASGFVLSTKDPEKNKEFKYRKE